MEDLVSQPAVAPGPGQAASPPSISVPCRFCSEPVEREVVDLGASPLANSYLEPKGLLGPEVHYPLRAVICESCLLVQLPAVEAAEAIFSDYAYFSSFSASWLRHAESFVQAVTPRFHLDQGSFVIEVASNDGYLLRNFAPLGIDCLGIEPARNVALEASRRGIPTLNRFLGARTARAIVAGDRDALALPRNSGPASDSSLESDGDSDPESAAMDQAASARLGRDADLVIGNNVFAHVPKLNDFTRGLRALLARQGLLSLEFPHLLKLLEEVQFDTIYHEHFSYFSFSTARRVLEHHGLEVFDVEELPTHGGSLRVFARRADAEPDSRLETTERVAALLAREAEAGLLESLTYDSFGERVVALKMSLLSFLLAARQAGKTVVGYGAPAKGNTLLNYCGVDRTLLRFTVDRSPHKQGRFLPGSRIPIAEPDRLLQERPDFVLILPWNLRQEIVEQMAEVENRGGRFVVAVPEVLIKSGDQWRPPVARDLVS